MIEKLQATRIVNGTEYWDNSLGPKINEICEEVNRLTAIIDAKGTDDIRE